MPIAPNIFSDAVRGFWNQRIAQRQAQELLGKIDQGNRRDVTGGKQMDGFALAITNLLLDAGITQESHQKEFNCTAWIFSSYQNV